MHWWFTFEGSPLLRRGCLLLLLLSSLALPLLGQEAASWRAHGEQLQRQLQARQQLSQAELQARTQLAAWNAQQARWQGIDQRLQGLGWAADQWQQHSVEVQSKRYSRQAADLLLLSLKPSADAFLLADNFSLKVVDPDQSLLVSRPQEDETRAVLLTLEGTYYSRRAP